jgi:hypothetical protein
MFDDPRTDAEGYLEAAYENKDPNKRYGGQDAKEEGS